MTNKEMDSLIGYSPLQLQSTKQDKIDRLLGASQDKLNKLVPQDELLTIESVTDMDSFRMVGEDKETRINGLDAYEVYHNDPTSEKYFNSKAGKEKMYRQKQHYADKHGLDVSQVSDGDIHKEGARQTLQALYELYKAEDPTLEEWTPGPTDYYADHKLELGSKENPLGIKVIGKNYGEGYFGRPLRDVYNKVGTDDLLAGLKNKQQDTNYGADYDKGIEAEHMRDKPSYGEYVLGMDSADGSDRSVVDQIGSGLQAVGQGFLKTGVVDTLDWAGEALDIGDLGTEQEKEDMVAKVTGYNDKYTKKYMEANNKILQKNNHEIAKKDMGWFDESVEKFSGEDGVMTQINRMVSNMDGKDFGEFMGNAFANTDMTGYSVGMLVGMMAGTKGLGLGKVGIKAGTTAKDAIQIVKQTMPKGSPARYRAIAEINKEAYENASGLQKAVNQIGKNSGLLAVNAGQVNDQLDEFEKNTGRPATAEEKVYKYFTNLAGLYIDRLVDTKVIGGKINTSAVKKALKPVEEIIDKLPYKETVDLVKKLGTRGLRVTAGGAIEVPTEGAQTAIEEFNKVDYSTEQGKKQFQDKAVDIANAAGSAIGMTAHMAGPKEVTGAVSDTAKAVENGLNNEVDRRAKVVAEERASKAEAEIKETIRAKGNVYGEDNTDEGAIGEIKKRVSNDEEFYSELEKDKQDRVSKLFEVENGRIVAAKPGTTAKEIEEVMEWANEYGKELEGSQAAKEAVEELTGPTVKMMLTEAKTAEVEANGVNEKVAEELADKVVNKDTAKLDEILNSNADDKEAKVESYLNKLLYNEDGTRLNGVNDAVEKAVRRKVTEYVSKFNNDGIDVMEDANAEVKSELKAKTRPSKKNVKNKVRHAEWVSSEALTEVMNNGLNPDDIRFHTDSTKDRTTVINKLDKNASSKTGVGKVLKEVGSKIEAVTANYDSDKVNEVFKDKPNKDELNRMALIAINTINGATATDTEQRARMVNDGTSPIELNENEYWASHEGIVTQAGKDWYTSLGIKVEGSKEYVLREYRKAGELMLDILTKAGIAEVSENEMLIPISDNMVTADGNRIGVKANGTVNTGGVATGTVEDKLSGAKKLAKVERGVRLTDSNNAIDENSVDTVKTVIPYRSEMGDAVKRLVKLVMPANREKPGHEKYNGEMKIADGITPTDDNIETVDTLEDRPLTIQTNKIPLMMKLKEMRDNSSTGLGGLVRKNKWLAELMGMENTKSELLSASEVGINNTKLQIMNDMLDILDEFVEEVDGEWVAKPMYFEYQIDVNNRISLVNTILNFQHDSKLSRFMLTSTEKMEIGDATSDDRVVQAKAVIEDAGIAKTAKDYEILVDALVNGTMDTGNKEADVLLDHIYKMYKLMETKSPEYIAKMLMSQTKPDAVLGKLNKKIFKAMNVVEEIGKMIDSKGDSYTSEYMVEMDASASGVFITMMNILGRNPDVIKRLLTQLNVGFDGKEVDRETLMDAYKLLENKVLQAIDEDTIVIGSELDSEVKTNEIEELLKELGEAGIDTREMAKPVVMTWFYSAGDTSIVSNLVGETIQSIIRAATSNDSKNKDAALKHISRILGKEVDAKYVREIKARSKDHKKLVKEYSKIGEKYVEQLGNAFPEVTDYKAEMAEMYDELVEIGKVNGKDYFNGKLRTASGMIEGGSKGYTSVYKAKEVALDADGNQKREMGLLSEMSSDNPLLATVQDMPNSTSLLPVMTHTADAYQLFEGLKAFIGDSKHGVMTVHDAYYGYVRDLMKAQEAYNKAAVTLATKFDMVEVMIDAMRRTANDMLTDKEGKTVNEIKALESAANSLIELADKKAKENADRMTKKEQALKKARVKLLGVSKADTATGDEVKILSGLKTSNSDKEKVEDKSEHKSRRETAKEWLNTTMFDTEATLHGVEEGSGATVHQIGYMTAGGKSGTIFVGDTITDPAEYYGPNEDAESAKANGLMTYEAYLEQREDQKIMTIDEAKAKLLELGKDGLTGFNNKHYDGRMLNELFNNDAEIAELMENSNDVAIMLLKEGGSYEGKQVDYAIVAGVDTRGAHKAEDDAKMLQGVLKAVSNGIIEDNDNIKEKAIKAAFNRLISGGDLSRYIHEIGQLNGELVKGLEENQSLSDAEMVWFDKIDELGLSDELVEQIDGASAFTVDGKVYISKHAAVDNGSMLDVINHELVHTVVDKYVRANSDAAEVKYMQRVLDRLSNKEIDSTSRLGYIVEMYKQDKVQGVLELLAVYNGEGKDELVNQIDNELNPGIASKLYSMLVSVVNQAIEWLNGKSYDEAISELGDEIDSVGLARALEIATRQAVELQKTKRNVKVDSKVTDAIIAKIKEKGC